MNYPPAKASATPTQAIQLVPFRGGFSFGPVAELVRLSVCENAYQLGTMLTGSTPDEATTEGRPRIEKVEYVRDVRV